MTDISRTWNDTQNFMSDPLNILGGKDARAAAEQQYAAQQQALAQQQSTVEQARGNITENIGQAATGLGEGVDMARNDLSTAQNGAMGSLAQGYNQSRQDMSVLQGLQGYGQGATSAVQSGKLDPYNVTGQQHILAGRMRQGDDLYGKMGQATQMQQDPGYQFRQQQGEQAINRSAAAKGGRLGGATLKSLADYNSGLASQEYGAADARNMSRNQQQMQMLGQQYGAAGSIDQMNQAAAFNQAGRSDAAGQQYLQNQFNGQLAAQQNQMGLAQMGYGAQSQLAQGAQQYGQQSAGLQSQYGQNMATTGTLYGQGLADLYKSQAGMEAGLADGMNNAYANFAQYGGMQSQAAANQKQQTAAGAAGVLGSIFCDENLKENIVDGSEIADKIIAAIKPHRFEYKDKAYGEGEWLGVMAQELEPFGLGLVVKTDEGRQINAGPAIAALLGLVARLGARIEQLEKKAGA